MYAIKEVLSVKQTDKNDISLPKLIHAVLMIVIITSVIIFVLYRITVHTVAKDYIGVYICNLCDGYDTKWNDHCPGCGTVVTENNCRVQKRPYCEDCGKKEPRFSKKFCDRCGGRLINNEKVPVSTIKNPVTRWCVKRL